MNTRGSSSVNSLQHSRNTGKIKIIIVLISILFLVGVGVVLRSLDTNKTQVLSKHQVKTTKVVSDQLKIPSNLVPAKYQFTVVVAPANQGPDTDSLGHPVIHPDNQSLVVGQYSIAYFSNGDNGMTAVISPGQYVNILISPSQYDVSVSPQNSVLVSEIGIGANPTPNPLGGIWFLAQNLGKAVITLTHKGPIITKITGRYTVNVTKNSSPYTLPVVVLRESDNGKTINVPKDKTILLESCNNNHVNTDPSTGILQSPTGPMSLPLHACGIWTTIHEGTAVITATFTQ